MFSDEKIERRLRRMSEQLHEITETTRRTRAEQLKLSEEVETLIERLQDMLYAMSMQFKRIEEKQKWLEQNGSSSTSTKQSKATLRESRKSEK